MTAGPIDATLCICDGFNLLLPSVAIAEVVSGVSATLNRDATYPWLLGEVTWRGQTMRLVSFEQLLIQRNPRLRGSHILVIRTPAQVQRFPFIGVPVQAIPTAFRIADASQIQEGEDNGRLDFVARHVRVRGVDAVIPDLAAILNHIASCLADR